VKSLSDQIGAECRAIAEWLAAQDQKIVLAESCTAGLVVASLAAVPGISRHLCGSAVTYRETTKTQWLGVSPAALSQFTAVSDVVARAMAAGVLRNTPEADLAVAVTGHLGPDAPPDQDGQIFIATGRRDPVDTRIADLTAVAFRLTQIERVARQHEAALLVLQELRRMLIDSQADGDAGRQA
jgi:nicotinamide-nucleotide amidase